MLLDHLALRVYNKEESAQYYIDFLGYYQADTFDIDIKSDGKLIHSIVLDHPNANNPELFISDGDEGSIIDGWLKKSNGPGLHHMAYRVEKGFLDHMIKEWKDRGIKFTSKEPITCPDGTLRQIFTVPNKDNVVIELLEREDKGFCKENVAALVLSTDESVPEEANQYDN